MSGTWIARVWQEFHAGNLTRAHRDVLLTLRTYRGHGGLARGGSRTAPAHYYAKGRRRGEKVKERGSGRVESSLGSDAGSSIEDAGPVGDAAAGLGGKAGAGLAPPYHCQEARQQDAGTGSTTATGAARGEGLYRRRSPL
jgi:hypothetical protein